LDILLTPASYLRCIAVNIPFPTKQAYIRLIDYRTSDARRIGAVNTVLLHGCRRIGQTSGCLCSAGGFRRGLAHAPRQLAVQKG
ncbi:shikimate dehydrogenase, partial [Pseudomonas aeruginosa]